MTARSHQELDPDEMDESMRDWWLAKINFTKRQYNECVILLGVSRKFVDSLVLENPMALATERGRSSPPPNQTRTGSLAFIARRSKAIISITTSGSGKERKHRHDDS
jgi:hypothetical protein